MTVASRIFTQAECEALTERILDLVTGSDAVVTIGSSAVSMSEFARGETHIASELPFVLAMLSVAVNGRQGRGETNQLDEAGLRALVTETEKLARENCRAEELAVLPPQRNPEGPQIDFDATVSALDGEYQADIVHRAIDAAEASELISAGDLSVTARARAIRTSKGFFGYERSTYGEVSLTARGRDHRGSGWAWSGFEDWDQVDVQGVIDHAVDIGRRSANPVAIEPGRYTVILEPAAVAALISPIIGTPTGPWSARMADAGGSVFSGDRVGTNKIGLQMMDRRLSMVSSPWDPERPASTIGPRWKPIPGAVTWFDAGFLRNLAYDDRYARETGREPVIKPGGVRLSAEGPTQTLEEMIAATRRGVWVNRLSHIAVMNDMTLLLTGTTRDGTFLIEDGKITKPIKNFRFTESPFFVLNQLEAFGEPVRASRNIVAPRLKLRDFNFSSLTDAI